MAIIKVISDPQIEQTPIETPLDAPSQNEVEDAPGNAEQQTKKVGIAAPLVKINNVVFKPSDVISFELTSEGFLPEIQLTVNDAYQKIKSLDQPKADNELRIQILPPFDNAYKKIDLTFSIEDIVLEGPHVTVNGIYKLPDLFASRLQTFGEISTFDLFNQISNEIKLGFASNISSTDDQRYIYCRNNNYLDLIKKETVEGGNPQQILQSWIDPWNYLNFVDIFERYNAKDKDLKVWVQNSTQPVVDDSPIEPKEQAAVITNQQDLKNSQLYIERYEVVNGTGSNVVNGTDRVLTVYRDETKEWEDILLQDGDVKKDVFTNFVYMGEQYGKVSTLLNKQCNRMYIQKISNQAVEVILKNPMLGLQRGHRVDFWWYDMNDMNASAKSDLPSNSDLPEDPDELKNQLGQFTINKMVSGQYLIYKTVLSYDLKGKDSQWHYNLTLIRPQDEQNSYYQKTETEK